MTLAIGRTADPAAVTPAASAVTLSPGPAKAAAPRHHFSFRELLSELNPLQYIPVIGTLFRAVTGDVIPEPVRDAGSLVFSTLIAGPIGAAVSLGELAVEKVTGIDPEKIGDRLLADIGIDGKIPNAVQTPEQVAKAVQPTPEAPIAWSRAQLTAYGVTTSAGGELEQGGLKGSDVLNSLELDQLRAQHAVVQYAAVAQKPS